MTLFICALPQEAKHLRKIPIVRNGRAKLICSGIGARNADRAARKLLTDLKPSLAISTGVAGALTPGLRVGDVVVAREVIDESTGDRLSCTVPSSLRPPAASILSVTRMITSAQEKKALAEKFHADAIDMESAAIMRVCAEQNVPFAAIRAISDTAADTLPEAVTRFFDADGRLRTGRVLAELAKDPSLFKSLKRLQSNTAKAGEALASFLQGIPD